MLITSINRTNRHVVNEVILNTYGSSIMQTKDKSHILNSLPGFIVIKNSQILGIALYDIAQKSYEIVAMTSFISNTGIGSMLLQKSIETAHHKECEKIWLVTTNDDLESLSFFQKRKFELVKIHRHSITRLREESEEETIPIIGNHGIPLKHELELVRMIK